MGLSPQYTQRIPLPQHTRSPRSSAAADKILEIHDVCKMSSVSLHACNDPSRHNCLYRLQTSAFLSKKSPVLSHPNTHRAVLSRPAPSLDTPHPRPPRGDQGPAQECHGAVQWRVQAFAILWLNLVTNCSRAHRLLAIIAERDTAILLQYDCNTIANYCELLRPRARDSPQNLGYPSSKRNKGKLLQYYCGSVSERNSARAPNAVLLRYHSSTTIAPPPPPHPPWEKSASKQILGVLPVLVAPHCLVESGWRHVQPYGGDKSLK